MSKVYAALPLYLCLMSHQSKAYALLPWILMISSGVRLAGFRRSREGGDVRRWRWEIASEKVNLIHGCCGSCKQCWMCDLLIQRGVHRWFQSVNILRNSSSNYSDEAFGLQLKVESHRATLSPLCKYKSGQFRQHRTLVNILNTLSSTTPTLSHISCRNSIGKIVFETRKREDGAFRPSHRKEQNNAGWDLDKRLTFPTELMSSRARERMVKLFNIKINIFHLIFSWSFSPLALSYLRYIHIHFETSLKNCDLVSII